jgi:small subunit ribosomal protein S3
VGHKSNPIILRRGLKKWEDSIWYSTGSNYCRHVKEDYQLRKFIHETFNWELVTRVIITRTGNRLRILLLSSRLSTLTADNNRLLLECRDKIKKKFGIIADIQADVLFKPDTNAEYISSFVAAALEKRANIASTAYKAISRAILGGVKGIRIEVSGRLNGSAIARKNKFNAGCMPSNTFSCNITMSNRQSHTKDGIVGVKVYVYNGGIK